MKALLTLAAAAAALAQNPAPEVVAKPSADTFRDETAGFAMPLAGGFRFGGRQENIAVFVSNTTPGVVFIRSGERFTDEEIAEAVRSGYSDEGVALLPAGPGERLNPRGGRGQAVLVKGTLEGQEVRGLLAGFIGPAGQCFVLLAATTPAEWPKLEPAARRIASGVELSIPKAPPMDEQWRQYFAGARLSYYTSSQSYSGTRLEGGSSGATTYYLCSDGRFFFGEKFRASFDVPQALGYVRTQDSSSGNWSVQANGAGQALLTFSFHDGTVWRYRAQPSGGVVYMNSYKYFKGGHDRCR